MKEYTLIWEDNWMSGSHMNHIIHKTFIRTEDVKHIVESQYGERALYIFRGFVTTLGEEVDEEDVITIEAK